MPDTREISALTTAESTSASDLFETALPNAMTETGYISRKVTLNTIATFILNTLQFQALNTTVKNIIGAINELEEGGGGGGASVALGTTDPSPSSGSNGDLYIKYDGTSYEVLAMFVKINGDWREIETGGDGENQCGAFVDYTDLITTVTFTNGSASYTATTDCYAIIRGYYVDNTTAIQIKVDGVLERGSSRAGSAIALSTFMATSVLLKKGQTLTVDNCLSTTNDNYIKIYGLQYSSPNLQPVIYSEEEREIGVWVDGKPLYEKSFSVTSPVENVATNIVEITSLSVDEVVGLEGVINAVSNAIYIGNTDWRMWTRMNWDNTNKDYIACNITNASYASQPLVVTIQYTKTTDTAGSGTWTPQGVPAVHYSTDEQVVGTWIDGKPIYKKSYPITNTNISTGWNILINNVSDIDTFVSGECALSDSSYGYSWEASYHHNGDIAIYNFLGGDISSANGYVTIQYTKSSS